VPTRKTKPHPATIGPAPLKPIRILDGDQLAAVVTPQGDTLTIRVETGYRLASLELKATMEKKP